MGSFGERQFDRSRIPGTGSLGSANPNSRNPNFKRKKAKDGSRVIRVGGTDFKVPLDEKPSARFLSAQDLVDESFDGNLEREYGKRIDQQEDLKADQLMDSLLADPNLFETDAEREDPFGVEPRPRGRSGDRESKRGIFTDLPLSAAGGIRDAIVNVGQTVEAAGDWLRKHVADDGGRIGALTFNLGESQPDTVTGAVTNGIVEWMSTFYATRRVVKNKAGITNEWLNAPISGAITDLVTLDADDPTAIESLIEVAPFLKNPITEYFKTGVDDSFAEKKFKQALEGVILGELTDGVFKTVRMIKHARAANNIIDGFNQAKDKTRKFMQAGDKVADNTKKAELQGDEVGKAETQRPYDVSPEQANRDTQELRMMAKEYTDAVETARRRPGGATRTRGDVASAAAESGFTLDDLQALTPGEVLKDEEIWKMLDLMGTFTEDIVDMARVIRSGEAPSELRREFLKKMLMFGQTNPKRLGVITGAADALNILNEPMSQINRQIRQLEDVLNKSEKTGLSFEKFVDLVSELKNPREMREFTERISRPDFKDFFLEYWINSMLSSITTPIVNAGGNTVSLVFGVGERKLAEILGKGGVSHGETRSLLYGMIEGQRDAWAIAWRTMRTGESMFGNNKIENHRRPTITAENVGASGTMGTAVDWMGVGIRVPSRVLLGTDEFFKYVNYRGQVHALALDKAMQELGGKATAEQIHRRAKQIVRQLPEEIDKGARNFADYQTFTNDLGQMGRQLQDVINGNTALKVVVPFFRTPVNLFKYAYNRTPVLQALGTGMRADLAAGGRRAALAKGRIGSASLLAGTIATMAYNGLITGAGPSDPRERAMFNNAGIPQFSVKVGDTWLKYNRLDPIGMTIGTIASIMEDANNMDNFNLEELTGATVLALSQNMVSKTYLKGVADFMHTVMPSNNSRPEDIISDKRNYMRTLTGSVVVPSVMASLARSMDAGIKDVNSIKDQIMSRAPFASFAVRNQLDVWGDERMKEGSGIYRAFMPIEKRDQSEADPIKAFTARNEILLGMPRERIFGVRLNKDEYWDYVKFAGEIAKKTAIEAVENKDFELLTPGEDGGRSKLMKLIHINARKEAVVKVLKKYPELRRLISEEQARKATALTGEEFDPSEFSMESLASEGNELTFQGEGL